MGGYDNQPAFSYQVPYWWPVVLAAGAAATGGVAFIAVATPETVVGVLVAVALLLGVWRALGWSQFYRVTIRSGTIEFRAILRTISRPMEDVVAVSSGRERAWWRARSGYRVFFLTLRDGRELSVLAGKGTRDFADALSEAVPGLRIGYGVGSPRREQAAGRSGFVRTI